MDARWSSAAISTCRNIPEVGNASNWDNAVVLSQDAAMLACA